MDYKAFISYSHAADGQFAPALQSGLHRFARPWYRMRAMRVFRDQTNLSASPHLWVDIERALGAAEFFLLLGSPGAARSKWVHQEVDFWLTHRSSETLLLVITEGDVEWNPETGDFDWQKTSALPTNLRGAFGTVPHYLDFRWARTATDLSLHNPVFRDHIADIAATLLRRPKDEIIGEDVRQHRRTKQMVSAAVITLSGLTAIALYQRQQAIAQRTIAIGRQLAAQSELVRNQQGRLIQQSVLLAIEAMQRVPSLEADQALRAGLSLMQHSVVTLQHQGTVLGAAFRPDGRTLVTATSDGAIRLWNVKDRHEERPAVPIGETLAFALSPDGAYAATANLDKAARIVEVATGRAAARLDHDGQVNLVSFSANGKYLATGSKDATVRIWAVPDGAPVATLRHGGTILSLAFVADDSLVATGSLDGTARLWRLPHGDEVLRVEPKSPVVAVAMSSDRRRLITAGREPFLRVWDTVTSQEVARVPHQLEIESVRVSTDGALLAAAGGRLVQV
jgi:TIR domain/WD domain, G-beta repeat